MFVLRQARRLGSKILRRYERMVLGTGRKVECPYCGWTGWRFLSGGERRQPNRLCPRCGSLERYRMLALLLDRELAAKRDAEILEIAPKSCLRPQIERRGWRYMSADLSDPAAMLHADLRQMPVESDRFDAIVCFHVMEHIADDLPAFREIGRMLKPDGFGVICVPLGGNTTLEGAPKSEWARLYGQHDHVRLYGMDIVERMRVANLSVTTIDSLNYFSSSELDRRGLRGDDRFLFVVRKQMAA